MITDISHLIQQLLLPVFLLMILIGVAGGNPAVALNPLFDICGKLVGGIISLACQLIGIAINLLVSGVPSLLKALQSAANRQVNK